VDHLADLPHPLFDAIRLALYFLSFDELDSDERPPRRIWMDADAMRDWWAHVKRLREEKYGKSDSSSDLEDDPGGYTSNAAAKDLMR
jgi:hypothetical protein